VPKPNKKSQPTQNPTAAWRRIIDDELQLIRKRELAALLRVNPWTIDAWRKTGRIPQPLVLSAQFVAWRRSDIIRWLDEAKSTLPQMSRGALRRAERP
jgi:predicted DNA-binding transcriptional regulator AlpA